MYETETDEQYECEEWEAAAIRQRQAEMMREAEERLKPPKFEIKVTEAPPQQPRRVPGNLGKGVATSPWMVAMASVEKIAGTFKVLWKNGILVQAVGVPLRHLLALYGLYRVCRGWVSWSTGLFAVMMWVISGLGVTAGVHRLWTHQSYKATPLMECLLMVMFSCADQGAIVGWTLTHAMHHTASDMPGDPHNRAEGFWHCHFGWLYSLRQNRITNRDYMKVMSGLGPIVHFHDKVSTLWDPFWSHCFPGIVCSFWGEFWNGFFIAGSLRWFCVQHITFFVNSVAHGEREPGDSAHAFDSEASGIGPRVSFLTSFLALGEGWHDYHHLFPWDYAAAELGALDQWNPTKVFIDTASKFGLVHSRRRCSTKLQLLRRQQLIDERYEDDYDSEDENAPPRAAPVPRECTGVAGPLFFRHRVMVPAGAGARSPEPFVSKKGRVRTPRGGHGKAD